MSDTDNGQQSDTTSLTTAQQGDETDVEISEITGKPKIPGGASGKGFVKGDPRINRLGRPKSFTELRRLAQSIGEERSKPGSRESTIEALLRELLKKNPERFVEIAYGKVPEHLIQDGEVVFRVVRDARISDTSQDSSRGTE